MALTKVTYVDNETVIEAQNLNDIQDEIIANASDIDTNADDINALETTVEALSTNGASLTSSDDLNDLAGPCMRWCNNVTNKPANSSQYGYVWMPTSAKTQFYYEFPSSDLVNARWWYRIYTNNQWYNWAGVKMSANPAPVDISSSITYNLSFGEGYVNAYYYPDTNTVRGAVSVFNMTTTIFNASTAAFTIPSGYRPASEKQFPAVVKGQSGDWVANKGSIGSAGDVRQRMTNYCLEFYMTFEYVAGS